MPCEKLVSPEWNMPPPGVRSTISGQASTKKSSSRKSVVIISVVARPNSIPWLLRNTIPRLLPPTAEGVIHDVNSQRKSVLKDFPHDSWWSVKALNRQESPKSRPAIPQNPKNIQNTVRADQSMLLQISSRFSFLASWININTTTLSPIATGRRIFHVAKVLCGD